MLFNKKSCTNRLAFRCFIQQLILVGVLCTGFSCISKAQICPPNIDFETGTFEGWTCYTGSAAVVNGQNAISLGVSGATNNRHTMYTRTPTPELDPYGGFPVVCPNGSSHSIRLGNNIAGTEAEGISYEFTIPAGRDVYSLIYHYAVVFQDPNHLQYQQPRMEIEITNVTDNMVISCSSFTFIPYGSTLPGFFLSPNPGTDTPVWCKDWSAVSINLDGNAGKTIRLFFKTADCTFRRHFGYAYIDINSECSGEFTGAKFCPGDTAVQLSAPFGYEAYNWFTSSFSEQLGSSQVLTLKPAPPAGSTFAVQVTPYNGYGCPDTLFARLSDTFSIKAMAGNNMTVCNDEPVQLGGSSVPGVFYNWTPSTGLSDATISNPFVNAKDTTTYILTGRNYGGGCVDRDTVTITPVILSNNMQLIGPASWCLGSNDSTFLKLTGADTIQWYKNNEAIAGGSAAILKVTQSGSYYAMLYKQGCVQTTAKQTIYVEKAKPGIVYPVLFIVSNTQVPLQARQFGDSVRWSPGNFLNTTTSYRPVFSGAVEQSYAIQIKTPAGCVTVDTQSIKIVGRADIFVPNAFTPNHDGSNDVLRPILYGIKELHYFRVYNRWGELLFETTAANGSWDGTSHGKLLVNQTVVWVAEGVGIDGKTYLRKGTSISVVK